MSAASAGESIRRVQRPAGSWPVVHLEAQPPEWQRFLVDGLVRHPRRFDLEDLAALGIERRREPLHCVWGWSRPIVDWEGVGVDRLLDIVEPQGSYVTVHSSSDTYSACLPIEEAARGMLVWRRDGEALTPEAGGPLRFVAPPTHWAYKGVKWAARLTVGDRFVAGFWESKLADPVGRIPEEVELP